jgi:NAD(P)-dependent dehydrogenase (short-subunit alcohol dehydrogenase family)
VALAAEGAGIIGFDICHDLATCEYPLATEQDLAETVERVEKAGGRIIARGADVRDRAQVEAALGAGLDAFGRLDFVLANAGIMPILGDVASTQEAWTDGIGVMLTGVFNTVDLAIPHVVTTGEGGAIIITSSTAGLKGFNIFNTAGGLSYVAAKHGVVGLMRAWANTVHPTGVDTPMIAHQGFADFYATTPGVVEAMANVLPVPMLEAADIANTVVFLCSDEGRYITGVTLPVDAGVTNK